MQGIIDRLESTADPRQAFSQPIPLEQESVREFSRVVTVEATTRSRVNE